MNRFFVLSISSAIGMFTISQSFAQSYVFDFYFYLLPFGMALAGLFASAGIMRLSSLGAINAGLLRTSPSLLGGFAIVTCVALYVYGGLLGPSFFFVLLILVQLIAYASLWSAIAAPWFILAATGAVAGLVVGDVLVAHLHLDPLIVALMAGVACMALSLARHLQLKLQVAAYVLIVSVFIAAAFQARGHDVMPGGLGWKLDYGKVAAEDSGKVVKRLWGRAGLTQLRTLGPDGRAAWLYTNGTSPAFVPLQDPNGYDNAWWEQNAPLTMAIYDAVQPKSVVDVGVAPSDMAWRAIGRGARNTYGLYGSLDWVRLQVPGLDSIRKSVVLLQDPLWQAKGMTGLPVDMIVLASGHEGKEGWTSSNPAEQTLFDRKNLLWYWQNLAEDGVLVLLSREQPVFFRQTFSVWGALKEAGMSDAEFLDHAWGVVPETESAASPYHYALVLTKKARDARFAQAIRQQVIHLPVKYLFGYAIPPSRPYDYFYQNGFDKVETLFTQGLSGMFRKNMSLGSSSAHRSIPFQFVEEVYPQCKNMLVLSVGVLIGIILFPLQKLRGIEYLKTRGGPGVASWMVAGGVTGALITLALAFLLVYPAGVHQEYRLLVLAMLMLVATLASRYAGGLASSGPALASVLGFALLLAPFLPELMGEGARSYAMGVAGILLVWLGMSVPAMRAALAREAEPALLAWWWLAMAAGGGSALFWSMGLYAALGDGLLLIAGLLVFYLAGMLWWHRRLHPGEIPERVAASEDTALRRQALTSLQRTAR